MPDKIIDIPGRGPVAFPDSMTPDQINTAASKLYQEANKAHPPPAKEHSWIDTAIDWIPTAAGAVGGLVGSAAGPIGAVGGAALGGATGKAVQNLLRDDPAKPMGAREALTSMASAAGTEGAMQAVGGAVAPLMARAGAAVMQSAIKPGIKATARAFAKGVSQEDLPIVRTLLKEGVNVSPGGIAKLDKIINATNAEIKDAINTLPGKVNPQAVATRTQRLASDVAKQVDPGADVSAVEGVTQRFLTQPGTTQAVQTGTSQVPTGVLDASGQMTTRAQPVMGRASRDLTLAEAQEMKTGTYRALKEKAYGEMKGPEIEANKALARGLKEEIEREVNKTVAGLKGQLGLQGGIDIGALNAREGAAIVTKEAIATRIAQAGNRDPVALAWLASNPTTGLLFLMERSPAVKSMLERGLYQSASRAARVPENVIRVLVQSIAQSADEQEPVSE